MEGATSSAYRWAISVPIRRSRGKKGGGGLGRNVYCEDEERWEVRWEVRCRLLVLRKISQQKSPGGDLGRDLMRNIMIIAYLYKNEFLDI